MRRRREMAQVIGDLERKAYGRLKRELVHTYTGTQYIHTVPTVHNSAFGRVSITCPYYYYFF